jgi:hypothetical protein
MGSPLEIPRSSRRGRALTQTLRADHASQSILTARYRRNSWQAAVIRSLNPSSDSAALRHQTLIQSGVLMAAVERSTVGENSKMPFSECVASFRHRYVGWPLGQVELLRWVAPHGDAEVLRREWPFIC